MKPISLLYFASSHPPYEQISKMPSVIFYGTDQLRFDSDFEFHVVWHRNSLLRFFCQPFERYLIKRVGIGFRLDQAVRHFMQLRRSDVILAETDSGGLPLLFLKKIGLIRARVGFISAGLINALEHQQRTVLFHWYKWLLQSANFIVCWSPIEEKLFQTLTGAHARFVLLEADTDFYRPDLTVKEEDFILCVGRDVGRDFKTLFDALHTTGLPAKVVTAAHRIKGFSIPSNVELILEHIDYTRLLDLYRRARLVVVNLQEIHRFTGQRSLLEALAMGKATIVAKTQALTSTYALTDGKEVVFYPPGDAQELAKQINSLYHDRERCREFRANARQFVEALPKYSFYHGVRKLIREVINVSK